MQTKQLLSSFGLTLWAMIAFSIFFTACEPSLEGEVKKEDSTETVSDSAPPTESILSEAKRLEEKKEYDQALALLHPEKDQLEDADSLYSAYGIQILELMGDCYRNKRVFPEAISYYQSAMENIPQEGFTDLEAIGRLCFVSGFVYRNTRELKPAIAILEKGKADLQEKHLIDSKYYDRTYRELGICYSLLGQNKMATILYDSAIWIIENRPVIQDSIEYGNDFLLKASSLKHLGRYGDADAAFQKSEAVFLSNHKSRFMQKRALLYNDWGILKRRQGKYFDAIQMYKHSLAIKEKIYAKNPYQFASNYNNLGIAYAYTDDFGKAVECYKKALELKKQQFGEKHYKLISTYQNLGGLYGEEIKDYHAAISYTESSLEINLLNPLLEPRNIVGGFLNLAKFHQRLGDRAQAKAYLDSAAWYRDRLLPENNRLLSDIYGSLGDFYGSAFPQEAYQNMQKSIVLERSLRPVDTIALAKNYTAQNRFTSDWKERHRLLDQAIQLLEQMSGEYVRIELAIAHREKGLLFAQQELFHESIVSLLQSQQLLENTENSLNTKNYFDKSEYIKTKKALGNSYLSWYQHTDELVYLDSAYRSFEQLVQISKEYVTKDLGDYGKQSFIASNKNLFEKAIHTGLLLAEKTSQERITLEELFPYFDLTKGIAFLENMRKNDAISFGGVPKELVEEEKSLRLKMAFYEKQLLEESFPTDSLQKIELLLSELKLTHQALLHSLEQDYPSFYNIRFQSQPMTIKRVQQSLLKEKDVWVEYFVGADHIFLCTILPDTFFFRRIQNDFPLNDWVKDVRCEIFSKGNIIEPACMTPNRDRFPEVSHRLYDKLFESIEELLPAEAHLIIVPDEILGYIPFEVLLTVDTKGNTSPHQLPYLLLKYPVSYAYSASLQEQIRMRVRQEAPIKGVLGIAPTFEDHDLFADNTATSPSTIRSTREGFAPLEHNIPEVEEIQRLMGGKILIGPFATEERFLQLASQYSILHLSTHGKANDELGDYSYLAFYQLPDSIENEKLYSRELYDMELNADLVVLSACETGLGELRKGEGIISMARGFSYAGTQSIVMSLWNTNDRSTKELMVLFYQNLKQGMSKSRALQQAKITYLNEGKSLGVDPFFWAGFVASGDMAPLSMKNEFQWLLWGGILLLGICLSGVFLYRASVQKRGKKIT